MKRRVAELGDEGGDLQSLGVGARRQKLDHLLGERPQREGGELEVEPPRLDLGEIENVLDQRSERFARGFHRPRIGRLLRRKASVEQQVRHAENAAERRADLVGHHGEEPALRPVGGLRLAASPFLLGQRFDVRFEPLDVPPAAAVEPQDGEAGKRQHAESEINRNAFHRQGSRGAHIRRRATSECGATCLQINLRNRTAARRAWCKG